MRGFFAALTSSEIYQGCRTSSERSKFSESSSEPTLSPSASAREIYEGLRTPDLSELSFRSADNERVVDGENPSAADAGNIIADNERVVDVKLKGNSKDGFEPIAAQILKLRELAAATKDFSADRLLGQGGFGRVYTGRLKSCDEVVAIKQFGNESEGNQIFLTEVLMQSLFHRPNIVNFVGYCADGDQRLVVDEYMPLGSLEYHLHDLASGKKHLDWSTRMKIAAGFSKGLEFLHDKANPPVIFRALKSSNILLGEDYHPKLSDFGLAKLGPVGDNSTVSTRGNSKDGIEPFAAQTFTLRELAAATKDFSADCLLGQGKFGRVYKGRLERSDQVVAIKQFGNGSEGNQIFLTEVLMQSLLHHPNIVNLVGYCADGDQRLVVHEYMPLGSLEYHLHDRPSGKKHLDWSTRMKIAAGVAKGLNFLHKANPPVIFRALKSSNILLGENYHPKLSDFGLAKFGPVGGNSSVSTRVIGTSGYIAQLSLRSDIFNFGVVLLEIITGRKAIDISNDAVEPSLVAWARPLFEDPRKFEQLADPMLQGRYPKRGLYQAVAVAAMCFQEQPDKRPAIADVVAALTYIAS